MRSRSVVILSAVVMKRRSRPAGWRRARRRRQRSSIADVERVHVGVLPDGGLGERVVAVHEGLDRVGDLLLDQSAHREDVLAEVVQLFFVLAVGVRRHRGFTRSDR